MLQVAQSLSIKANKVVDPASGKEVEIAGSIEVKGIKGQDKRQYIVDLQGMTPRDANFLGDEYHTCLVRPELISLYQKHKNMQYAGEKMEAFTKQMQVLGSTNNLFQLKTVGETERGFFRQVVKFGQFLVYEGVIRVQETPGRDVVCNQVAEKEAHLRLH